MIRHCSAHHRQQRHDDASPLHDYSPLFSTAKLSAAFHAGVYACPAAPRCTVRVTHIFALQEHCVEQHGEPLTDAQRLDFFDARNSNSSATTASATTAAAATPVATTSSVTTRPENTGLSLFHLLIVLNSCHV